MYVNMLKPNIEESEYRLTVSVNYTGKSVSPPVYPSLLSHGECADNCSWPLVKEAIFTGAGIDERLCRL